MRLTSDYNDHGHEERRQGRQGRRQKGMLLLMERLECMAPNVWAWPTLKGEQARFIAFYTCTSFQSARFFMTLDQAKNYAQTGRDV
jgi:hypothetical protein